LTSRSEKGQNIRQPTDQTYRAKAFVLAQKFYMGMFFCQNELFLLLQPLQTNNQNFNNKNEGFSYNSFVWAFCPFLLLDVNE